MTENNFNRYRVPHSAEELERDYRYYDESGRRYRTSRAGGKVYRYYADEGKMANDWWVLPTLNSTDSERAGYPTQKPIALYKRIIEASSNEGDLVLDPFCGCGTTLLAAEELNRRWLGIDLTYLATGAVKLQVEKFFPQLKDSITLIGTPENVETALQLAREDHRAFEEWCITHVLKFTSNAKKVADGGIDGMYRFPIGKVKGRSTYGKMVAQVKGGSHSLGHIRDFRTGPSFVNIEKVEIDNVDFVLRKGMLLDKLLSPFALRLTESRFRHFRRHEETERWDAHRSSPGEKVETSLVGDGIPAGADLSNSGLF